MIVDLWPMLSDYWLKPMAVLVVLVVVTRRPGFRSAAVLHFLFFSALVSMALVLTLTPFLPAWGLHLIPVSVRALFVAQLETLTPVYLVAGLYFLGTCWTGFYTLAGVLEARRLVHQSHPPGSDSGGLQCSQAMVDLREQFAAAFSTVRIRVHPQLTSPLMVGWRAPVILLPAGFVHWSAARLTRVLAHELAHVERSDWLTKLLVRLACVFFWPIPLVWFLARRVSWYAEIASDDRVVELMNCRAEYADDLLELSSEFSHHAFAMAYGEASSLYRRIDMILDPCRHKAVAGRPHKILLLLVFIGLWSLVAVVKPLPLRELSPLLELTAFPEPANVPLLQVPEESPIADGGHRFAWALRQLELENKPLAEVEAKGRVEQIGPVPESDRFRPLPIRPEETMTVAYIPENHLERDTPPSAADEQAVVPGIQMNGYLPLEIVMPEYPRRALLKQLTGRVIVRFDVDENGRVQNAEILSSPHGNIFDQAVLTAVTNSRFMPLTVNNKPVITKNVTETFVFTF